MSISPIEAASAEPVRARMRATPASAEDLGPKLAFGDDSRAAEMHRQSVRRFFDTMARSGRTEAPLDFKEWPRMSAARFFGTGFGHTQPVNAIGAPASVGRPNVKEAFAGFVWE